MKSVAFNKKDYNNLYQKNNERENQPKMNEKTLNSVNLLIKTKNGNFNPKYNNPNQIDTQINYRDMLDR